MPGDASTDIQVAHAYIEIDEPGAQQFQTVSIEMGGRGQVVELWGVNYIVHDVLADAPLLQGFACSLSSNPEYLRGGGPAAGYNFAEWGDDPSVYARWSWWFRRPAAASHYDEELVTPTPLPMYGIVRPRRQVFLCGENGATKLKATVEVYYRPIHLAQADQDAVDRKYGKYRRE